MTETEYTRLADDTLRALEAALETVAADIDFERGAGGILEIECAPGSMIVVNKQAAAREIWVAAKSGGFHFRWDGTAWRDTRGGEELFQALSRCLGEQAGEPVSLV